MVRTKHKSGVSGLDLAGDVASYAERSKNGNISCREKYRLHNHGKLPSAGQIPVPESQGPLSQMLSLPEKWDYTLQGLAYINREQIDAIRQAVHELERAGYIVRARERDGRGRLRGAEYTIYEQPQAPSALPTLE